MSMQPCVQLRCDGNYMVSTMKDAPKRTSLSFRSLAIRHSCFAAGQCQPSQGAMRTMLTQAHAHRSYCLGNAAGMMQLRRRDVGGPTRLAVIAYNIVFFGFPIVWFGVSIVSWLYSVILKNVVSSSETCISRSQSSATSKRTILSLRLSMLSIYSIAL